MIDNVKMIKHVATNVKLYFVSPEMSIGKLALHEFPSNLSNLLI